MTQKQLLEEAKKTEKINMESLKSIVTIDLFKKTNKPKKLIRSNYIELKQPIIRLKSQLFTNNEKETMTLNTLNFQNGISNKQYNKYFSICQKNKIINNQNYDDNHIKKIKYCDPLTGNYFYDVNTFRKLRKSINSK